MNEEQKPQKWESPNGKKMLTYSPEFAEEAVKAFDAGESATDIGRRTGRKAYMICLILKRAGRDPSLNRRHGNQYPADKLAAVKEFYLACGSTRKTGDHFDINQRVVRDMMVSCGAFRPQWTLAPMTPELARQIVRQWGEGEAVTAIARSLKIAVPRVVETLTAKGVVLETRHRSGSRHKSWRGGRHLNKRSGYWWVHVALDDPLRAMASEGGYVMEHRLVVARHLGRPLTRNETVHHINGDKGDNRLENLQLRHGKHGKGVVRKCNCCGSTDIAEVPLDD